MNKAVNIIYVIGWLMYLIIFVAKKSGIVLPYFLQSHFADLLAIPLVLGAISWLLKKYTSKNTFELSVFKVLFACLYFSILFEWILPQYSANYTGDIIDVICYFIGGGIYYHTIRTIRTKDLKDAATL